MLRNSSTPASVKCIRTIRIIMVLKICDPPSGVAVRLLLKHNIHHTIILQSKQLRRIPLVDTDLKNAETIEYNKTFSLVRLIILSVYPSEFFSAKLNGERLSFAKDLKSFSWDIGDKISEAIDAYDGACNLFFCCLYLTVDHLFEYRH